MKTRFRETFGCTTTLKYVFCGKFSWYHKTKIHIFGKFLDYHRFEIRIYQKLWPRHIFSKTAASAYIKNFGLHIYYFFWLPHILRNGGWPLPEWQVVSHPIWQLACIASRPGGGPHSRLPRVWVNAKPGVPPFNHASLCSPQSFAALHG